jgi:hypothetical protein
VIFRVAWVIDAIIAGVCLYFFVVGLNDGSVSSFNIVLWLTLLGALGAVLWGGRKLRASGHPRAAVMTLLLPAVPGVLMGLFFLVLILGHPDWR